MTMRYTSSVLRRAVVEKVDYTNGTIQTRWLDDNTIGPIVPIPHPFGNRGGSGIFTGIKIGAVLALAMASYKTYVPVAVLPINAYYDEDDGAIPEADFNDLGFPSLRAGDIVIQGQTGSIFRLNSDNHIEEIVLFNEFGEGKVIGGGNDSFRCSLLSSSPVDYIIAPYGIGANGIIRRDVKTENFEESFVDFLYNIESEQALEEIGWDPSRQVSYISSEIENKEGGKLYRNPAFVENRLKIYEFGKDWNVGRYDEENARLENKDISIANTDDRTERRNNTLGLSLCSPNELMELIKGTVVDIFGNVIDINRRIIEPPTGDNIDEILTNIFENIRHSLALHMEINTRKGWRYTNKGLELFVDPQENIDNTHNNARDRSRWFVDIDKEGLTKVNIPASSETGNVPTISRYESSSVLDIQEDGVSTPDGRDIKNTRKIYRNDKNRDIFSDQVGPGGIKFDNSPDNRLEGKTTSWDEGEQNPLPLNTQSGTAFHNILKTAKALIDNNIKKSASDVFFNGINSNSPDKEAVSSQVINTPPENGNTPNAGGRSLHLNLDGSLETSIGANTVDRVSWILDTAGALVCRLGRDKAGRSALIHADGTVAMEVGGFDFIGENGDDTVDTRFVGAGKSRKDTLTLDPRQFRSGKVVIKVRRANISGDGPEDNDTVLIIDETGITVETPGRMNFISEQNMTLTSKSLITLDAPKVQVYRDNPRYFARSGRLIK